MTLGDDRPAELKIRRVPLDTGRENVIVISRRSKALRPEIFRGFSRVELRRDTKALLATNPLPTETEILQALRYNLCRCGAHIEIVRAAIDALPEDLATVCNDFLEAATDGRRRPSLGAAATAALRHHFESVGFLENFS